MTDGTKNIEEKEYGNFLQYVNRDPEELLILFKQFAPRILKQKDAQIIFKELTNYLTDQERKQLFQAWEDIQTEPGEFYSIIQKLIKKYESLN